MRFFITTLMATMFLSVFAAPTEAPNASCDVLNYKLGYAKGISIEYESDCPQMGSLGCNYSYRASLRAAAEDLENQLKAAGCADGSAGQ
jgi:hypothetical protein